MTADIFVLLAQSSTALTLTVFVLGLLVGSFLNVVILRLPRIMDNNWQREAREFLQLPAQESVEPFNLVVPRSRCPHCGHQILWYENIPVVSWLALRGRCSQCKTRISARYPVIELIAALLGVLAVIHAGYGLWLLCLLGISWSLLALTMIDFDTTLLPDSITLPLMWAGLLAAVAGISPVALTDAVIGAAAGYLALWSVYWAFKLLTGKEGMGYGDFKLLAALGAWVGWQMIPMIILLSSVVGAVVGGALLVSGVVKRDQGIPFGPYLAGAGLITLFWGSTLIDQWFQLFRF